MRKSLNLRRGAFIRSKPNGSTVTLVILNNFVQIVRTSSDDKSIEGVPYQLSTVVSSSTVVLTGNGGLGFDSGEGA